MVVSMAKFKRILQFYPKCFYDGFDMTLECKDIKPWLVFGA